MGLSEDGVPWVELPERVDRRLRLGPFPSARDALKFLCYAAAGAVLAPFLSLPGGLALAALGFVVATWRPDGLALDERALTVLRWKLRSGPQEVPVSPRVGGPLLRRGYVGLSSSEYVAVIRTGGAPMAYLPPAELARRFESYRDLLRASEGRFAYLSTLVTIHARSFSPGTAHASDPDAASRAGYAELVRLLCRRRLARRVFLAVAGGTTSPDSSAALEGQISSLTERLVGLGLRPVRLKDRALLEAARSFGWAGGESAA